MFPACAEEPVTYPTPPEAIRHDGVPQGQLIQGTFRDSRIYPGTERDYWVYLPAQLAADKPAPLMVFQDGQDYCNEKAERGPTIVFDNLIHEGAMPPTIGLFINPGVVPAASDQTLPRFNRSFEYDDVSDRYARFLIEEMIPFVESTHGVKISERSQRPGDLRSQFRRDLCLRRRLESAGCVPARLFDDRNLCRTARR